MKPTDNISRVIREKLNFTASAELHQRILADALAARPQSEESRSARGEPNIGRTIMKSRISKLATAAVIVAGVLIGVFYVASNHHGSIALGEVIKEMQQVKTATWTEIGEVKPPQHLPQGAIVVGGGHIRRCAYKAPGHERQDTTQTLADPQTRQPCEFKHVHIIDRNVGKALLLDPQKMTAALGSFEAGAFQNPLYDVFLCPAGKMLPDAQSLGTQKISGREAIGLRLYKKNDGTYPWSGDITDIWFDAQTRLLVMLETKAADDSWGFKLTDFVFNKDLDDSLFSLDVPAGYTMTGPSEIRSVSTREEGKLPKSN
jgi:hypothetical protein